MHFGEIVYFDPLFSFKKLSQDIILFVYYTVKTCELRTLKVHFVETLLWLILVPVILKQCY